MDDHPVPPTGSTTERPSPSPRFALRDWVREGLRAGLLFRPRLPQQAPSPLQLVVLLAAATLLQLGLARLEIRGPAMFSLSGWLAPWWTVAVSILLYWSVLWRRDGEPRLAGGVAGWFALAAAGVPPTLVSQGLAIARAHGVLPAGLEQAPLFAWGVFLALLAWEAAIALRIGAAFGLRRGRLAVLAVGMLALQGGAAWQTDGDRAWYAVTPPEDDRPRLTLSQETFEHQQQLWAQATAALAPQRPEVVDVYGIVFAPYAQDVFLRESAMVAEVLAQRFDAQGRVLRLVNHPSATDTLPWATPANLRRAIAAVAQRMDREHDLLVVYLTSHGGRNAHLAAAHWPLSVSPLTPQELRQALDEAGVRHRVLAVSACYSGSWVEPLAGDDTLVMTAADADHTSYGCGSRSELTFFGRAVFDEQLRRTHSFEQAFAAAMPVIRQREIDGHKTDGFSNPQIRVGPGIRPLLAGLEQRLDSAPAAPK